MGNICNSFLLKVASCLWEKIALVGDDLKKELKSIFMNKKISEELSSPPPVGDAYYERAAQYVWKNKKDFPRLIPVGGHISYRDIVNMVNRAIYDAASSEGLATKKDMYSFKPQVDITPKKVQEAISKLESLPKEDFIKAMKRGEYGKPRSFGTSIGAELLNMKTLKPSKNVSDFYGNLNINIIETSIFKGFKNNYDFIFDNKIKPTKGLGVEESSKSDLGWWPKEKLASMRLKSLADRVIMKYMSER